jgi:type I restriction enzyme, S subunit
MSFPRHTMYKDSGIKWLGNIPEHWTTGSLKSFARPGRSTFVDGDWIESPYITDSGFRLIQTGNVGVGQYREQGFRFISEETFHVLGCTEVLPGDVLICRLAEPVGRACLAPPLAHRMVTSVDVCILKTSPRVSASFVVYLLSCPEYLGYMEGQCRGGTRDRVSRSFLGSIRLALPPLSEQCSIAAFLDRETRKIDTLVGEQKRLIELLREKRQAAISHSVTRGLDPKALMKHSGVEWLGQVPAHWGIMRIKRVAKMESGHTPDKKIAAYWTGCNIPWVSLHDTGFLKENDYISDTAQFVNELGIANSSARLLPPGAVVFSRDATIGRCAITTRPMAVSQHFIAWICSDCLLPEYLLQALRVMMQELERLTFGATVKTIGMPDVGKLTMPLPSLLEQRAIVAHITKELERLNALKSEAETVIALLRERRSALISAAVTGKIDVRGLVPAEAEAA